MCQTGKCTIYCELDLIKLLQIRKRNMKYHDDEIAVANLKKQPLFTIRIDIDINPGQRIDSSKFHLSFR